MANGTLRRILLLVSQWNSIICQNMIDYIGSSIQSCPEEFSNILQKKTWVFGSQVPCTLFSRWVYFLGWMKFLGTSQTSWGPQQLWLRAGRIWVWTKSLQWFLWIVDPWLKFCFLMISSSLSCWSRTEAESSGKHHMQTVLPCTERLMAAKEFSNQRGRSAGGRHLKWRENLVKKASLSVFFHFWTLIILQQIQKGYMEAQKQPDQKETHLSNHHFGGPC